MTERNDRRGMPPEEEALQALFDRSAAHLSDDAARRLDATARSIPGDTARGHHPWLVWLTAGIAVAAALIAFIAWPGGGPISTDPSGQPLAHAPDAHAEVLGEIVAPIVAVAEELGEDWGAVGFFMEDEAPSLVGSVSLAHGLGDDAELELWVQAADEILAEVDEI
jgi:hypothetical protein